MSPLILAILVIVCVGAAGFALVPSLSGSSRATKRMKALQGDIRANRIETTATRDREARRREIQSSLRNQTNAQKQKKRISLSARIHQAGMKIKPAAFIRNSVITGVIIFVVLFIVQVELLYCLVLAGAGGYLLPRMYLNHRRKKYQNDFLEELPNAVEAIVRGVKSGLPLNDSMRVVARDAKEPIRSDFQRVLDQQSMGKAMHEAIMVLYERVPLPEVNFFVVVINVQSQAGGNLSEALSNLARVLRNRKKMKAKVKAMSSEAKASAGIIGSLPFIVALLVTLTTPNYLLPLIETDVGKICLGIACILMFIGGFIMNRMIQFDI